MKKLIQCMSLALWLSTMSLISNAQDSADPARIEKILSQLTQDEKISLLSGATGFGTAAIPRLGVRAMSFTDGTNGVRSNDGLATTAFPVGLMVAATWDQTLAKKVGEANGEEVKAVGAHVLLGPNLNLVRTPQAGRNFETYGEDPYLAARMGVNFIQGVQSKGVGTSAKHYIGNEQETERNRSSSNIDERTLREIYLQPFEAVVREAHPWTIMTSYNRVHGIYMSENSALVRDLLKGELGYDGAVMSDWGGTHSFQSVSNGLDLEMPGPPRQLGTILTAAARNFQVPQRAIDDAARRMLRLAARVGNIDVAPVNASNPAPALAFGVVGNPVSSPAHRQLARDVAAAGITLLKNASALLPLDAQKIRSIAVIGPNADAAIIQGGGSAQVKPSAVITPLDSLRTMVGQNIKLTYVAGVDNNPTTPTLDPRLISPDKDRKQNGLATEFFANDNFSGTPAKTSVEQVIAAAMFGAALSPDVMAQGKGNLSVRWKGYFWPSVTGEYEFTLETQASTATNRVEAKLTFDDRVLLDNASKLAASESTAAPAPNESRIARIKLMAGQPVPIKLEFVAAGGRAVRFRLGLRVPTGSIDEAVRAARNADVAIVFVGSSTTSETEGRDRESLKLFGKQDELVAAITAANPRTIVVLNNAGPVEMPWVDKVPAIVEAWLPGQEGPYAVADVLFGKVNPSGKLPISFPKRVQDNPAYLTFPGGRDVDYGEGLFIGYRYYDKKEIEPLFPFGHGLSYTTFAYSDLKVASSIKAGEGVQARVTVRNSGKREGEEVAQLYLQQQKCSESCVVRELKAFDKVALKPGESKTITFTLDARSMQHYDVHEKAWRTEPGRYVVAVGGSSRDLKLSSEFTIDK